MSKALRSMGETERREAIKRRLMSKTGGLGYWSAVEAARRIGMSVSIVSAKEEDE